MAGGFLARSEPRRFRLPALIRRQSNALAYLILWAPYIAVYQLVNRFPVVEPVELPFTWLDRALPFLPELLPLYVSYIPFYFWTVARSENDREASRIFYVTHLQLMLSLPFFLFFPVTMPRDLFYAPEVYNWADAFWRWFDAPNNCFPSLHVSNCLMLIRFNRRRPHARLTTAVGLAIIVSTVLVRQHYVVDVLGGAAVYFASSWFLARLEITGVDANGWRTRTAVASASR